MIRIFKSGHVSVLVFLLLYATGLKIIYFIQPLPFNLNSTAPLSNFIFRIIFWLFGNNPYWENVLVTLLILSQALQLQQIINHYKILSRFTFLPAMTYLLLSSLFWEFAILSPALIANTFIIAILKSLFSTYKKDRAAAEIFDLGFLLGIASLFYLPSLFFILLIYLGLNILRPFNLKEWLTILIGLLIPYFLISTYYFWNDQLPYFLNNHFLKPFSDNKNPIQFNNAMFIECIWVALLFICSLFAIRKSYYKSIVQLRKIIAVFLWMTILGFFSFVVQPSFTLSHSIIAVIPFTLFIAYLFSEIKNNWLSEAFHLILLLIILCFQYNFLF